MLFFGVNHSCYSLNGLSNYHFPMQKDVILSTFFGMDGNMFSKMD